MNINMKVIGAYAAGVVTAPAWIYVLRKPLGDKVGPFLFEIVADEKLDKSLHEMMLMRNDFKDIRDKHGEKARQLRAQGLSNEAIAREMGLTKQQVRWALSPRHKGDV